METPEPPCLLLAAEEGQRGFLRALLECTLIPGWEVREAGSCAEALSLLQQAACHVLLADEGLCRAEGADALARLAARADVPVVLLTDPQPAPLVAALGNVDLAELCITSAGTVEAAAPPTGSFMLADVADIGVVVSAAPGERCERCWRVLPEVGHVPGHDDLCRRCAEVIKRGAGAGLPLAAAG
jgi:CheY-like chemotaxis protein